MISENLQRPYGRITDRELFNRIFFNAQDMNDKYRDDILKELDTIVMADLMHEMDARTDHGKRLVGYPVLAGLYRVLPEGATPTEFAKAIAASGLSHAVAPERADRTLGVSTPSPCV
ncbi:MAG: hypothetical protein PHY92_04430 [Alphaproteobacteria bacterium]|nr:hypothetical protein [Alphaproteobacteria bacterium]